MADFNNYINTLNKENKNVISIRNNYAKEKQNELFIYKELFDKYDLLIKNGAALVKEIGIKDNSISYSLLIKRLIDNGCFSFENSFKKSVNENDFLYSGKNFGIQIVNGFGCCRHICYLHSDIFKYLNLYESAIDCYIGNDSEFHNIANHVANILEYEDNYLVHDTSNNGFYTFTDCITLKSLTSDDCMLYSVISNIISHNYSYEEMIDKLNSFKISATKQTINGKTLKAIINETNERYHNKKDLIEEFKHDSKKYVKEIKYTFSLY